MESSNQQPVIRRRGRPRIYESDAARQRNHRNVEGEEQRILRLSADAARHQLEREHEEAEERSIRRAHDSQHHREVRELEDEERRTARLRDLSQRSHRRREAESEIESAARHSADAQRQSRRRAVEDAVERAQRLSANMELQRRSREEESDEGRLARRLQNSLRQRRRRLNESSEDRAQRLSENAERQRRRRQAESTEDHAQRILEQNRRQQRLLLNETPEEGANRRLRNAIRQRSRRARENEEAQALSQQDYPESQHSQQNQNEERNAVMDDNQTHLAEISNPPVQRRRRRNVTHTLGVALRERITTPSHLGELDRRCRNCGALHFGFEVKQQHADTFGDCCDYGNFTLDFFDDFPTSIKELFLGTSSFLERQRNNFFTNIRNFNSALAMASMGAQVDVPRGRGPYCYRIHGQVYHHIGPLHPNQEHERQYDQIYVLDTELAAQQRLGIAQNADCDSELMVFF